MPLSFHKKAMGAHQAAAAASLQGKFWEMHDKIFGEQRAIGPVKYEQWAKEIGLDVEKWKKDMVGAQVKQIISQDQKDASSVGVTGTPAFFVNGKYLSGAQPFAAFKRLIDAALKEG